VNSTDQRFGQAEGIKRHKSSLQCSIANGECAAKRRASRPKPRSGRREIGGTRQRVPNASTRYQDTLTGFKLHFAAVGCYAT
jgi:hypothetical protein